MGVCLKAQKNEKDAIFWQSASLGHGKNGLKIYQMNRQRSLEKQKEPTTLWNWGYKDP